MARNVPDHEVVPGQQWQNVITGGTLLVLAISDDVEEAYCAVMDENKVSPLRVSVPYGKLKHWGNRGFELIGKKKGKLPAPGDIEAYPEFSARKANFGAQALA
jgi:hypothetical protein